MPKLKTHSSCKKRFTFTATGKVKMSKAGKRHNMRKRSKRMLRQARGTAIMSPSDTARLRQWMPYH